jgi:hypothetical protein
MIVVGAGMAGLLAAAMLRNECTQVIEKQSGLPNNHSAVLRFRSTIVADVLNIPFKPVDILKAIASWRNPVADAMSYSYKSTGLSTLRSVTTATSEIQRRYIAPHDLILRMNNAMMVSGEFGVDFDDQMMDKIPKGIPIISTLPMPVLMDILGWKDGRDEFSWVSGLNIVAKLIKTDAYCSLYIPDPLFSGSRISITGDEMVVECPQPDIPHLNSSLDPYTRPQDVADEAAELCGINRARVRDAVIVEQKYAKILPVNHDLRKRFIVWATERFNIYSLGRFATWRPGLLLDDVVNDVRVIHRLIGGGSSYDLRKTQ